MTISKESNIFPGYMRTREVNKYALSQLIQNAIGDKVSQKDFASLCDVNPSTISRLISMKYTGTCSEELIKAIADITAKNNLESGVTLEKLLDAYGLEKTTTYTSANRGKENLPEPHPMRTGRKRRDARFISNARFIISNLVMNEYSVELIPSDEEADSFRDFELITNALDKQGISLWYFHQVSALCADTDPMTMLFYRAYLNIESQKDEAYSLISTNKKVFEAIVNKHKDTVAPDYVSTILIDTDASEILDEFVFQQRNPSNRVLIFSSNDSKLKP